MFALRHASKGGDACSTGRACPEPSAESRGSTYLAHETRQAVDVTLTASGRTLTGYAARFHVETRIKDFTETIWPGAFSASLKGQDVLALVDHDPAKVLARTKSGTLKLSEDDKGLRFSIALADTSLARDVLEMVKRGDMGGCSFGFVVAPGGEKWQGKRRELRAVKLMEISLVSAWPAYSGTSIQARAKLPPKAMALQRYLDTL